MASPVYDNLKDEEYDLAIDPSLLDKLQELELREDPSELGGMVAEVKRELQGMQDKSPRSVHQNLTSPSQSTWSTTGSSGSAEPAREGLAQSLPKSQAERGAAFYIGRGDEDPEVRCLLEKVMERLSLLERRLEKWNQDQQQRIERILHNRHASNGSVRSNDLRMPPLLRWAGIGDKGLMPTKVANHSPSSSQNIGSNNDNSHSHSNHKPHGKAASCPQEHSQPEREQSPLQEDEADQAGINGYRGRASRSNSDLKEKEVKQAVRDWVAAEAIDIRATRNCSTGADSRVGRQRSRSSTFLMLTTKSSDTKELVESDPRKESGHSMASSFLSCIVSHPAFDYFFATMIMLNALFIGVQTEYRARSVDDPSEPPGFAVAEKVFAGLFFMELAMRMIVMKLAFFSLKHLSWNMFDLTLVLMSVIEVVLTESTGAESSDGGGSVGKVIRMFRMARIIRIMRVVRFLAELRIMVTLIIHSVRSLFWLMVLLVIILYVFSIFFTQGVTDYLIEEAGDEQHKVVEDDLRFFYGGLGSSAYTLFTAITGGISWVDVVSPLVPAGWTFKALFIVYVFFCVFSVLNIVTGVFVDGAIQRSAQERDLRLEKEKEQKKMYVTMLMDLLEEIDKEGTGTITRSELEEAFQSEVVRYSFSVLDIDIADSNYLFDMLDLDGSGEVDMEEFVSGCLRLKGNAKSIDIHTLMFEVKHLMRKMDTWMIDRY